MSKGDENVLGQGVRAPGAAEALARHGLLAAGWAALLVSFGVVALHLGEPGLGPKQIALSLAGFAAVLAAEWLRADAATRTGDLVRYLTVAAEVAVLGVLIAVWRLEGPGVYERVMPLVFTGFLVHHALPLRFRPGFFLLLSVAGVGLIFGPANGALLLGIGAGLIALAHLPVAMRVRVALIVAAGLGLAVMRTGQLPVNIPAMVWPILASMFMFRMVVYLYDLRHGNAPPGLAQRLSYFFMLPNVVFPLFPVVDSTTYHRRYYDAPAHGIYQRGVDWIFRGVIHLVIYRYIYQKLTLAPSQVNDTATLAQYLVTTFGLYLRVSGQFHVIIGIMHLFGHRLPETHRLYFLASSFTDLWRRINIYWKEFVQKVFFFPVYFRARGRGETYGIVVATLAAFVATWALHSWQWFWILGHPLFTVPDVIFWIILGTFVLANSLWERKKGRIRKLEGQRFSAGELLRLGLGTGGTFLSMCVLWTVWNSRTNEEWITLLSAAEWDGGRLLLFLAGLFVVATAVAALARWLTTVSGRLGGTEGAGGFGRQVGVVVAGVALLFVVATPQFAARFSLEGQATLRELRRGDLNVRDAQLLQQGYYENLMGVSRLNSQLWEVYTQRPDDWQYITDTPAGRETGDFRDKTLVPGAGILFNGKPFRVNSLGMRDQEYPAVPAPGTHRIALVGASYVVGSGVSDGENFESVLEDRLNAETQGRYEILNFARPGFSPLQQLYLFREEILPLQPGALWVVGHPHEAGNSSNHFVQMFRRGVPMPWPWLDSLVVRAGLVQGQPEPEMHRRMRPFHAELEAWVYSRFVELCRARGCTPAWIYLPIATTVRPGEQLAEMRPRAEAAGFEIIDLADVYEGYAMDDLMLAVYDRHPNPKGHRVIAGRLFDQVRGRPGLAGPPAPGAP